MSLRLKLNQQLQRLEKSFSTFNEITVSKSAILHNFDFFKSITPDGHILPVLKSNAYGHGIAEVTDILKSRNFPYIAVDGYYEALAIRNSSKQPILVMGSINPDNFRKITLKDIAFVVHDLRTVEALAKTNHKVNIHIEIDTGMTRHGVTMSELPSFIENLAQYKNLEVEGVMSHLADADNPEDDTFNIQQTNQFDHAVELFIKAGFNPKYIHLAQSAGSTKIQSTHANTMRIGIAFYGINPLDKSDPSYDKLETLQPALSLTSTITKVSSIEEGESVSYGRTYRANSPTKIGVIPLGYFEGIPRLLSNTGTVQYNDSYFRIAGRVCMNHTMIDLEDSDIEPGSKVIVISRDKSSKNSINNLSQNHNLFNYSLLTGLNQNIRRRIVD